MTKYNLKNVRLNQMDTNFEIIGPDGKSLGIVGQHVDIPKYILKNLKKDGIFEGSWSYCLYSSDSHEGFDSRYDAIAAMLNSINDA